MVTELFPGRAGLVAPTAVAVVAASDSSRKMRRNADFRCNGTDDDLQIKAAIAAGAKHIVCGDGTFVFSTLLELATHVFLEGQGRDTVFTSDGTLIHLLRLQNIAEATVKDIHFDANSVASSIGMTLDAALRCRFYNLSFSGFRAASLRLLGDTSGQNCALNRFYNTTLRQTDVGIVLNGNLSPLRPVTLNSFFGLEITGRTGATSVGIQFADSVDNNYFHDVRIEATTNNSTGVVYNSSSASDTAQEVYENHFYGYVWKGAGAGDKSIDGNATKPGFPSYIYEFRATRTDALPAIQDNSQVIVVTGNLNGIVINGFIPDPGDGDAIPTAYSGRVALVTGGAETRTLADALGAGLTLDLYFKTDGGDCVVTAASPINQAGNTVMTFEDIGDHIRLTSIEDGSDFEWRVVANDGVALT